MEGNGVVDSGSNAGAAQMFLQLVPHVGPHHVEMVNRFRGAGLDRTDDTLVHWSQELIVNSRGRPALLVPAGEVPQFDPQNSGLQRIEAPVVAFDVMIVLPRLPVVA